MPVHDELTPQPEPVASESSPEIVIEVECNFCNRFHRQLLIKSGNVELRSNEFDARSQEAKRLALNMIYAAQQILTHHELNW